MKPDALITLLKDRLPHLLAVYAFGSRVQGTTNAESDWDFAVLVEGYADPLLLWGLTGPLSDQLGSLVDLLDFRAASTGVVAKPTEVVDLFTS